MQTTSVLKIRNCAIRNRLFPLWYHCTLIGFIPEHQSWSSKCHLFLESYSENEQEIKTSLLSSRKLGTKKEVISLEMQHQWQKFQLIKQLTDLLVNTTKEIHIRRASIKSFVFYQELSENHFWLFSLFYNCELHWIWPLLLDNTHYHSELLRVWVSHFRQQCHICVDMCKRWHIKYSLDQFWWAAYSQP